jgi:Zn-finger nucleic acid-binding protein
MKCPVCPESSLLMTERQGVEIDYCPQCRGVWLDRGELDKLVERSSTGAGAMPAVQTNRPPNGYPRKDEHHSSHHGGYGQERHRKKSWLGEILTDRTEPTFNSIALMMVTVAQRLADGAVALPDWGRLFTRCNPWRVGSDTRTAIQSLHCEPAMC